MVEYSGFRVHTIRTYETAISFEETVIPMMEVCICRSISGIKRTNICFRLIRNAGFDQPEANIMDIFETY